MLRIKLMMLITIIVPTFSYASWEATSLSTLSVFTRRDQRVITNVPMRFSTSSIRTQSSSSPRTATPSPTSFAKGKVSVFRSVAPSSTLTPQGDMGGTSYTSVEDVEGLGMDDTGGSSYTRDPEEEVQERGSSLGDRVSQVEMRRIVNTITTHFRNPREQAQLLLFVVSRLAAHPEGEDATPLEGEEAAQQALEILTDLGFLNRIVDREGQNAPNP
jgi:hypothetical protein